MDHGRRRRQCRDAQGEHGADEVAHERPLRAAHDLRREDEGGQDQADRDAAGDEPDAGEGRGSGEGVGGYRSRVAWVPCPNKFVLLDLHKPDFRNQNSAEWSML